MGGVVGSHKNEQARKMRNGPEDFAAAIWRERLVDCLGTVGEGDARWIRGSHQEVSALESDTQMARTQRGIAWQAFARCHTRFL